MKQLLFLLCCFWVFAAHAGEGEFAVSKISPALLKNANAVMRVDEQRFEVIHPGKAIEKNRYVVTILNEKGDKWSVFSDYYDKHRKINNIEGFLYDAEGRQIGKMKTRDAQDVSGVDEISLMDDNRVKHFSFMHRVYPYTVEFSSEIEITSTLFFPMWAAQPGELISVERSSMEITTPLDYQYRYKVFNYRDEPVRQSGSKTKTDTWKVENLPALRIESFSPLFHEYATMAIFGPTAFKIEDYSGNMSSWKEFGKFVYALKQGRDVLPDEIRRKVHEMTDHLPDVASKINVLYHYLQKNTRYISIQLGIGGWQPFDAKFVAGKAYGDCKALTNYMFSLLKEAGITSYYTLVRAGRNATYLTTDFPSQQFNHVILCIPMQKDSTWLECTSQTAPAGYLGDFTNNRPALLINEEGGHLVMTKRYEAKENLQQRKLSAVLNDDASLNINSLTAYSGLQLHSVHGLINNLSRDKIKEYLQSQLDLPTYDIAKFSYEENKSLDPVIHENLEINVTNYANFTGKRLFIHPNVMNRSSIKLTEPEERKFDVVLQQGFLDTDSVTIQVPAGFVAETIPQDVKLTAPFGEYTSTIKFEGTQLTYYRKFLFRGGRFPPSAYTELVKFYEQIYKADRARVVLVKG